MSCKFKISISHNPTNKIFIKILEGSQNNDLTGLHKAYNQILKKLDRRNIKDYDIDLQCSYARLTSLEGIPSYIQTICCPNNQITSLKPLEICTDLKNIYCEYNVLPNLEGIKSCNNICCAFNELTTLEPLEKCNELICSFNHISSLKSFNDLTTLSCNANLITTLDPLKDCTRLTIIYCSSNQLTSLSGIENSYGVTEISCTNNQLSSLKELENFPKLTELWCHYNPLNFEPKYSCEPLDFYMKYLPKIKIIQAMWKLRFLRKMKYVVFLQRLLKITLYSVPNGVMYRKGLLNWNSKI